MLKEFLGRGEALTSIAVPDNMAFRNYITLGIYKLFPPPLTSPLHRIQNDQVILRRVNININSLLKCMYLKREEY